MGNDIVGDLETYADELGAEGWHNAANACRYAADEIERLRAVIVRAKDALLDGQSTQWVHDVLVQGLHLAGEQEKVG